MRRRTYLTSIVGVAGALAGCSSRPTTSEVDDQESDSEPASESVPDDEVPAAVAETQPLAEELHAAVREHYDEASVWINESGDTIALEYTSTKETVEALETELHQITQLYVDVVERGDHDPVTLSIVMGEVQAVVTRDATVAYIEGKLQEEAFYETIQITDVKRDGSGSGPEEHDHGNHDHDHDH